VSGDAGRSGGAVLVVDGLSRRYGDTTVVDEISFTVEPAETLTLLGPSGCGKSTTLRAVAGLDEIDGGEIRLAGRLVASARQRVNVPPEKRNLGLVFQSYAVWPHMTVFENVAYPLRSRRRSGSEIRHEVARVLELVGLPDLAQRSAHQLSGGQQQRVALARALVYDPVLLLLDEPLSNLDAARRHSMRLHLRDLQVRTGQSMLFVTHDQVEAMSLSARVAVMRDGRIEQSASPRTLYEEPASPFVFLAIGRGVVFQARLSTSGDEAYALVDDISIPIHARMDLGPAVTLGFRPSEVRLVSEHRDASDIPVIVDQVSYLGDHLECMVRFGRHRVRLQDEVSAPWEPGGSLWLRIPPSAVKIWPGHLWPVVEEPEATGAVGPEDAYEAHGTQVIPP
jgi:iron(III) transport system ATP-binding protein